LYQTARFLAVQKSGVARDQRVPQWRAAFGAVLGLIVMVAAASYLVAQREAALRDAEREVRNLSLILADWVEDGFRSVEQLELGVAEWVRAEGITTPEEFRQRLSTREAHEALRARAATLRRIDRILFIDSAGGLIANSVSFPPPDINVAGRDYFEALRYGDGPDTFLSTPLRNQVDGKWTIFVACRIRGEDGRLLGIAGTAVDLQRFEAFFAKLSLGQASSVTLARRDGVLVARHPWVESFIGGSIAQSEIFTKLLPVHAGGVLRTRSPIDDVERVVGAQSLREYPLVAVATRAFQEVLAPWRREAWRVSFAVLLIEGFIALAVLLANRQSRIRSAAIQAETELAVLLEREVAASALAERDDALRAIFDNGTVGIAEVDTAEYRFIRVNARFCEMTGRTEVELLGGLGPVDVIHPEDPEADLVGWRTVGVVAGFQDVEKRYLRPDGSVVWVRLSIAVSARNAAGQPTRCVALAQDITASRAAAEQLRASEEMLRLGMEVGRIGAYSRDVNGDIRCGAETRALHGLPEGVNPIPTATWLATILPQDRERIVAELADARARCLSEASFQYRFRRAVDGQIRHIEARARYQHDTEGRTIGAIGVVVDVTEAREAEALLRLCLEVGRIGTFHHDFTKGSVTLGAEARAIYGLPDGGSLSEREWWAPVLVDDRKRLRAEVARGLAARDPEGGCDYRVLHGSDGSLRHIEARARYQYGADGKPVAAVGVVIDVTERCQAEERIAHLAHHDTLTGLPNRLLFRERMDNAIARARRGKGFAVLCLDLDRFKEVNDALGHPIGDALLCAVANRLRAELRETDTLARLGGDEFAVIQSSANQPCEATALARRLVEAVSAPFHIGNHQISVGTSIGAAVAPDDGLDPDALLRAADMALYRAKADGRGTWHFFEPGMDARIQMRRALELDLRRALASEEFEVHYQPIVRVATRQVSGLEALVRWRHPERGLVPPDRFIPLCEEIGLIVPLGEYVLARACADAVQWPGAPKIAVNLSPAQFTSPGLVEAVSTALAATGLEPERLELEITETVMLQENEVTLATLYRLKALGVRIAMDDFGTGYSSLSYLQRFPFDKVKIDRCFIRDLGQSRQSNAIVRAMADLCGGLDMITTAEGVETEEQFAVLRRKGCDEAQGYLFSRPLPGCEIPKMLANLDAVAEHAENALSAVVPQVVV
jgi:diguanylate cyclase (GGDEF)-like protein/PAS domain S-box-containing protein